MKIFSYKWSILLALFMISSARVQAECFAIFLVESKHQAFVEGSSSVYDSLLSRGCQSENIKVLLSFSSKQGPMIWSENSYGDFEQIDIQSSFSQSELQYNEVDIAEFSAAIDDFNRRMTEQDTLYLFFQGHGSSDTPNGIPHQPLNNILARLPKGSKKVLISDTCHSGAALMRLEVENSCSFTSQSGNMLSRYMQGVNYFESLAHYITALPGQSLNRIHRRAAASSWFNSTFNSGSSSFDEYIRNRVTEDKIYGNGSLYKRFHTIDSSNRSACETQGFRENKDKKFLCTIRKYIIDLLELPAERELQKAVIQSYLDRRKGMADEREHLWPRIFDSNHWAIWDKRRSTLSRFSGATYSQVFNMETALFIDDFIKTATPAQLKKAISFWRCQNERL